MLRRADYRALQILTELIESRGPSRAGAGRKVGAVEVDPSKGVVLAPSCRGVVL